MNDKYDLVRDMIDYINENDVLFFSDFIDYACVNKFDWFKALCDNESYAHVIVNYIKSKRYLT